MTPSETIIPYGYCHCGCGRMTNVSRWNDSRGHVSGEPFKYISGHNRRLPRFPQRLEVIDGEPCVWISLGGDRWTVISETDFELVSKFEWSFDGKYARQLGTKRRLHQLIFPCSGNLEPDHKDGDELNNRRTNLRPATSCQQKMNRGKSRNNVSGEKGVIWHKASGKWMASIGVGYRSIYLGLFVRKEDAVAARIEAEKEYFGVFSR